MADLDRNDLYKHVFASLKAQALPEAFTIVETLLSDYPEWPSTYAAIAAFSLANQDLEQAQSAFEKAVALDPQNTEAILNLIQLLKAQGKTTSLINLCLHQLSPVQQESKLYLAVANTLFELDQAEPALQWLIAEQNNFPDSQIASQHFQQLLEHNQQLAEQFLNGLTANHPGRTQITQIWLHVLIDSSLFESALSLLQTLPDLNPYLYQAHKIVKHLWEQKNAPLLDRYYRLLESYRSAFPIPAHRFYRDWARCAHDLGQPILCKERYAIAHRLAPPFSYRFDEILLLPTIYQSEEEIQKTRQKFIFAFDKLKSQLAQKVEHGESIDINIGYPFGLVYQGLNDLKLIQNLGRFWQSYLNQPSQAHFRLPLKAAPPKNKLKIGIVSRYFHHHSVMICYRNTIRDFIQAQEFEVSLFHLGQKSDAITQDLKNSATHFSQVLEPHLAIQKIQEQALDILLFTDIGMNSISYIIALHRLAPLQVVLAGHPVTTGLSTIDYFISNALVEPPNAQEHYSEKLVLLPEGISNYNSIELPPPAKRSDFGWSETAHIYFCPMLLHKIHPSFDQIIAQILEKDPEGQIWFVQAAHNPIPHQSLSKRFEAAMPELSQRIFFLPFLSQERFYQAIQTADVMLESTGFGGGSTTRMVFGLHQPMVTLPGKFLRSRISQRICRGLKLEAELVAISAEDYVIKATQLACDPEFRQRVKATIEQHAHRLFNRTQNSENIKDFLIKASERYPELIGFDD